MTKCKLNTQISHRTNINFGLLRRNSVTYRFWHVNLLMLWIFQVTKTNAFCVD